jgi:hypothetical protein
MDVRHSQMMSRLGEHGWRVLARERTDLDWWADEIWAVESEWSPHGLTVFLTWLVDPQWDDHRRPTQAVWAVGVCSQRPTSRLEAEGEPLLSIPHWPRGLPEFLARLSHLRDQRRTISRA